MSNSLADQTLAARLARFREAGILLLLVAVLGGATVVDSSFASASNAQRILLWAPLLIVVAMGEMMVILTRGIDVSVGSILACAGMASAMAFRDVEGLPLVLGVLFAVFLGAAMGAFNGVLVAFLQIPPIIATLGSLSIYRGLTYIISDGVQVNPSELPRELLAWTSEGLFGIAAFRPILLFPLCAVVATAVFLRYARTGRNMYALGGNPDAARLRGIPVRAVLMTAYTVAGALAGLAGILYASRYSFVNAADIGSGFELTVIAAVVIGGVNIFGGAGSVLGVVLGCLLLASIEVALPTLGIRGKWQLAVYGLIIIGAVTADNLISRRMGSGGGGTP